jgi:mutator protein MutT
MESRSYPSNPIPGVGAIVVGKKGILLLRRDNEPGKGLISIPGGVIEVGETQEEAIIREIKEETGIQVELLEMIGTYDLIINDSHNNVKFHFVLIHYLARALSSSIRPEYPEGELKWVPLDKLPEDEIPPKLLSLIKRNQDKIMNIQPVV